MPENSQARRGPNRDRFANIILGRIRRAGETADLRYDPEEFCIRSDKGGVLSLSNAYAEYSNGDHAVREAILKRWVRVWFNYRREMPDEFEDIRPDLLPALRARGFFESARLNAQLETGASCGWPYQIVGEHLALGLVYDMAESMQIIRQEDLDNWGVTLYEALEVAMENLRGLPQGFVGPDPGPGLYMAVNQDSYDCSRMLLLDLIEQFNISGAPVALVPTRNNFLVAGDEDDESLSAMLKIAEEAIGTQPWPLSGVAFRLEDGEWAPWLPEPDHALYPGFKLLREKSLADDYAGQKELLDKLHQSRGTDIFVATYSVVQPQGSPQVFSYAVWASGVDSLLPRTDLIALMPTMDSPPALYPWQRVQEVTGDLWEPTELYPPRWRVREFPTAEQLAAIGKPVEL